jgi:hypothetical protein
MDEPLPPSYCPHCTGPLPPERDAVWLVKGKFYCSERCAREVVYK